METWHSLTGFVYSDGIARVHGMANVQAEELVEYATLGSQARLKLTCIQVCIRR